MACRLKLQEKLEELLESENVYYNPPKSLEMKYTAIRFKKVTPNVQFANNSRYFNKDCFELTVISRRPEDPVIEKILALPYTRWNQSYPADDLYHDVITIYY